jgi:hypothetical protein
MDKFIDHKIISQLSSQKEQNKFKTDGDIEKSKGPKLLKTEEYDGTRFLLLELDSAW